jgi:predicted amidohydrolase YtcJ
MGVRSCNDDEETSGMTNAGAEPGATVAHRRAWWRMAIAGLPLFAAACQEPAPAEPAREPADLILLDGAVYTQDAANTRASALAIRDGNIVAVGSDADVSAAYEGPSRDLGGRMVLPGFHDAHAHPISGGMQMNRCDLAEIPTVEAILDEVRRCDQSLPPGAWLIGGGWNLSLFPEANADKALLDGISTERRIFLQAADGHSAWVNSAALAAAGITKDTPDPHNGVIERNAEGEPSGTLRETAQGLVEGVLPPPTEDERIAGALAGLAVANGFGITSIADAAVDAATLATWRALEKDGRLTARILAYMAADGSPIGEAALDLIDPASRGSGALVRTDAAKIFLDGVLEGETAALLEPYLDGDGASGTLNLPSEKLRELVTELDARNVQVMMHGIGDRAVRDGLDAIEAARKANGVRDNRHHIAHLQLVHPDDYPRFAALGVTANFQSLWAFPDQYITGVNLPQVGQERVDRMYPIASIQRAGARIVFGSDWFVSSMNPLLAIETAVTRQAPDGSGDAVLNTNERISLETALAGYTREGAWIMHQEDRTGSLERGKAADVVVLARNLYEIDPREIGEVPVDLTVFAGKIVYERKE